MAILREALSFARETSELETLGKETRSHMRSRFWKAGVMICTICVLTPLLLPLFKPQLRSSGDVFAFMVFLGEDKTTYASQYTEKGFDSVRVGMPKEEVLKLLGQPLVNQKLRSEQVLRYSSGPNDSNYFFRIVVLDASSVVIEKDAHYFAD